MSGDPNRGAYRRFFAEEFAKARERLAPLSGTLQWGTHDYEAFTFEAPGIGLIFYPHRTSAKNYHIRVRAKQNSKPELVKKAIFLLAENSCTFQFPSHLAAHHAAVTTKVLQGRPGG